MLRDTHSKRSRRCPSRCPKNPYCEQVGWAVCSSGSPAGLMPGGHRSGHIRSRGNTWASAKGPVSNAASLLSRICVGKMEAARADVANVQHAARIELVLHTQTPVHNACVDSYRGYRPGERAGVRCSGRQGVRGRECAGREEVRAGVTPGRRIARPRHTDPKVNSVCS